MGDATHLCVRHEVGRPPWLPKRALLRHKGALHVRLPVETALAGLCMAQCVCSLPSPKVARLKQPSSAAHFGCRTSFSKSRRCALQCKASPPTGPNVAILVQIRHRMIVLIATIPPAWIVSCVSSLSLAPFPSAEASGSRVEASGSRVEAVEFFAEAEDASLLRAAKQGLQ